MNHLMKHTASALVLAITILSIANVVEAAVGFRISGRNLLDANGNNFIIRGVSHAHTWYPSQASAIANIKSKGANAVRIVLSGVRTPNSANDVANVISLCKQNRLICILENHDTTGYLDASGSVSMDQAVNYWRSIQSALIGQENYVIINIGNEPYGNNNASQWTEATVRAIQSMRSAGFLHTLIVDAPNWGQDWQFVMRDNAQTIVNADSQRNTMLSIHMYGVFNTASEIQSYISSFVSRGLPLLIGEFGFNHSDGDPDENTIMSYAQSNGIGWLGWSWSGNGGGVEYLDMVTNFNPSQPTSWGNRIFTGANGLSSTSQECSVYSGSGSASFSFVNINSGKCLDVTGNGTADGTLVVQWGCHGSSNQRWTTMDAGGGYVFIRSVSAGKCLDVKGRSTADGTVLQIWSCNNGNNQQFQMVDTGGGQYRLTPRHSGKAVDVANCNPADGATVQQWTWLNNNCQKFRQE